MRDAARGIAAEGAAQSSRLFLWAPVAFGAGAVLYFQLAQEPWRFLGAAAAVLFAGCAAAVYKRHRDTLARFILYITMIGFALCGAGFAAAQFWTARIGTPVLAKGIGPADLRGTVDGLENLGEGQGSRAVLSHLVIEGVPPEDTPRTVRVKFKKDEGLTPGQRIETLVRLDPPSGPVLPGAYDFRRHLFFDGIGGVGFAYRAATVLEDSAAETPGAAEMFFENLRYDIDRTIRENTGVAAGGIVSALITGERGAIAEEDNDAMRNSGLYHLLSISGTHVSMVAGVLFFIVRLALAAWPWAALRLPVKKIAAVAALSGAAFYVFLAGADVPAQRSLLMTGLVLLAVMLDRSPFSLRLIAFSALVVLAFAPQAVLGVSFQMSFSAVAALICFFEWSRPWWTRWRSRAGIIRKSVLYLMAVVMTSLIAGIMTGLFSLYHFQTFSFYGVLSNMIAVPLTGVVIMPAAVLAIAMMPFGLEAVPLHIMEWGVVWMLAIAHWTAELDGAVVTVRQWPEATYALMIAGTLLFLLWSGWRGKGVALFLIIASLFVAATSPVPDIMVADKGKLWGVTGDDGVLYVSSGRKDKFAAENWARLSGNGTDRPRVFADKDSPVLCDDDGCRMERRGTKIAFVRTLKAYAEDCPWADVVIGEIPLKKSACRSGARVMGLYDFIDNGAHAVFIADDGVRVRSVGHESGRRPWDKAKRNDWPEK